jgi:hypothetical protein
MSGRTEFIAAALLFALMLALRIVNITRYKFDSDEAQHLHVIWGWANGFVQYRDLCDNHMPLFQLALAPVYKLIGDRATILYWMRFVLLPMYFLAAWCTYRIGALCFSRRVGAWAVLITGLYPGYLFCALEFRTDNLWAPLWLLTLVVLLNGTLTVRRAVFAGLILGLCFGVSMKTTFLLLSILVSGALTLFFVSREKLGFSRGHLARCAATFLACTILIPATIMTLFAMDGVWPQFRYWVFENNIVPGLRNHPAWWIWIFPVAFPVVIYAGRMIIRAPSALTLAFRRGFVFFICGFYLPALWSFWSLVSRQDYLPYHPLAFVMYTGALFALLSRFVPPHRQLQRIFCRMPLVVFIVTVEFLVALVFHDALGILLLEGRTSLRPFWIDGSRNETELLRATLRLTEPGDFVIDEKGETVFRQRCFGPIWEPCVMERIERGLMVDSAAERCIETRTCVAVLGKDISLEAHRFILKNYLYVGNRLRVAGTWLQPLPNDRKRSDFDVVIPASYEITARSGFITGMLDGEPYNGARFLAPGRHSFVQTSDEIGLALVWEQAVDRHFTPFDYSNPSPDS